MRRRKIPWGRLAGLILMILVLALACTTERTTKSVADLPPETHLFLQMSDTLSYPGETTSMQILHWYGDDPDGEVVGFEWAWDDTAHWNYTTLRSDTFFVPITQPQDTFTFYIRAIDDAGIKDPTPDHLSFPIKNSPPSVAFPVDFVQRYSRRIYSCFSYFSIGWTGSDPDGDSTITHFEWYLADSTIHPEHLDTVTWNYLDSLTTVKVFNDLPPGSYRFFLRCRDVAGAYSSVVFYPDTVAQSAWNVMPVIGRVLYVDDNNYFFPTDSVNINSALSRICGADSYSTWNVTDRISYYPRDIRETLLLFDKVVWNGSSYPHFREASAAITEYVGSGGHLFALSTHARADTTIYPFLPIDSVTVTSISRIFTINKFPGVASGYPDTLSSPAPLSYSYAFAPGAPSGLVPQPVDRLYYYLDGSDTLVVAARYPSSGRPAQVIYFSLYVFDCSLSDEFYELMRFVLEEEFAHAGR